MEPYRKVLFVSDTDTCQAPMAAALFKSGPLSEELEADSRGIVALFPEPISEKAEAVMISKGIHPLDHKSTPLKEEDFAEDTLVLTITKKQYIDVADKFGDHDNVYSLSSFLGVDQEVPDPYGQSLKEYGNCFETLALFIEELEKRLTEDDRAMHQKILAWEGQQELLHLRQGKEPLGGSETSGQGSQAGSDETAETAAGSQTGSDETAETAAGSQTGLDEMAETAAGSPAGPAKTSETAGASGSGMEIPAGSSQAGNMPDEGQAQEGRPQQKEAEDGR